MEACEILTLLAQQDDFNSGMKYFATALCRSLLPLLRHRHSKVRMTATAALTYCMAVPDRAKLRGSGTEALVDLVGFKEENVLNVSAFYISTVSINYLAEIVQDKNTHVRMEGMPLPLRPIHITRLLSCVMTKCILTSASPLLLLATIYIFITFHLFLYCP